MSNLNTDCNRQAGASRSILQVTGGKSFGRGAWIAAILFGLAGILLLGFDETIYGALHLERLPGDLRRVIGLSEFFGHGFGVAVVLLGIWVLAPWWRPALWRVGVCAVVPGIIVNLMKLNVPRIRPLSSADYSVANIYQTWSREAVTLGGEVERLSGYAVQSFPSGHVATAIGLAFGLSWLMPQGRWYFGSLAALVALQRVASGAHWPSDVMIGGAIAATIAAIVCGHTRVARWFHRRESGTGRETAVNLQQAA